ncbi:MAG: phospholipase D-like domain-containing protein [Vulcanimicrobiota bacterium]
MAGEIRRINSSSPGVSRGKRSETKKAAGRDKVPEDTVSTGGFSSSLEKIPGWQQKYFSSGNKVTALADGQVTPDNKKDDIFEQIEKSIKGAKRSIQVEMFSLDKKNLVDLLIKEQKKGVKVQVIMDPANDGWEKDKQKAIDRLKKNGVEVNIYPVKEAGDPQAKYGQINHVKMMIIDGDEAIIGGMNWGGHSPLNHDFDVKVEGPAVDQMEWLFRKDWIKSGGDKSNLPYIEKTRPHPEANSMVNLITTGIEAKDQTIGKVVRRAIDNARKSVHTELFTLTDKQTVQSLIDAHKRGVDVKVILNPMQINGKAINERAANQLKEAGVPVRWYVCNRSTREKLHAKIGIFDDDQVIVSSANWTYAGFNINREAGVEVLSKDVNSKFNDIFKDDWENKTAAEPAYLEDDKNPGG